MTERNAIKPYFHLVKKIASTDIRNIDINSAPSAQSGLVIFDCVSNVSNTAP